MQCFTTLCYFPGYFCCFSSCFIRIGYTFYFTHLLLLALVVVVNAIIFALVMHRLTYGRKTRSLARDKREEMSKRVHNAIAITFLLGLTWAFGLLSLIHEDSSFAFQVLFSIFNSLQGFVIFVMFCVRQSDVVAVWREWITNCKSCGKKNQGMDVSQSSGNTGRQKTTQATQPTDASTEL